VNVSSLVPEDAPLPTALADAPGTAPYWPVRVRQPDEPPGTSLAELAGEAVADAAMRAMDAELDGGAALAAQTLLARLAGPAAGLPAELLFRAGRIPVPDPERMWFALDTGGARKAPVLSLDPATRLLVLPDDPFAGQPGIDQAPDRDRLRAALVEWAHDAFAPVVATVSRLSRRGRRALWQVVADRLGNGFLMAGRASGDSAKARAELEATLAATGMRPLRLRPDWLEVEHAETTEVFRRRAVCCLYYKSRTRGEQYCATCPLLSREESLARLRTVVAGRTALTDQRTAADSARTSSSAAT
jgi:FhuF 2Fe-2S C-terminal domain